MRTNESTHRSIGEVFDRITGAFAPGMGRIGAGSARVHSAAGGIDVRTKSVEGVFRTGYVRKTGIVGNPNGRPVDEFVGSNGGTTVAAPGLLATVEQKLNRQVDVRPRSVPGNFDAVCQGRHAAVCPAGSTVLRNVLIEHVGQHGSLAAVRVHPTPVKTLWERRFFYVRIGKRADNTRSRFVSFVLYLCAVGSRASC